MKNLGPNHYERAFESWLLDNRIAYIAIDETKKKAFRNAKIKSFDFLICPPNQHNIITEVKGKLFKGSSLAGLCGLECWVAIDDVNGLSGWQEVFSPAHAAAFVFAYRIEKADVDFDGRDYYDHAGSRYVFFAVSLDDYCRYMKQRSPKWRTVTLAADRFRQCAVQMQNLLL
jgi:hypothetical protein